MAMRKTSQGVRPFGRYNFSGKASLLHCPSVVSAVDLDPDGSASRVVLEPFIVVALDPREGAICTVVHIAVQCVLSLRLKSQSGDKSTGDGGGEGRRDGVGVIGRRRRGGWRMIESQGRGKRLRATRL
jgi:hypothetical protein